MRMHVVILTERGIVGEDAGPSMRYAPTSPAIDAIPGSSVETDMRSISEVPTAAFSGHHTIGCPAISVVFFPG